MQPAARDHEPTPPIEAGGQSSRPAILSLDPAHGEAYYFTDGISADERCWGSAVYIHPVTRKVVVAVGHGLTGRVGLREHGPACDAQRISTSRCQKKWEIWCLSPAPPGPEGGENIPALFVCAVVLLSTIDCELLTILES